MVLGICDGYFGRRFTGTICIQLLRGRSRVLPVSKQLLVIFVLMSLQIVLEVLVQWLIGKPPRTWMFCLPILTSLLVWTWLHRGLDFISQKAVYSYETV